MDWISENMPDVPFNLMFQYTPFFEALDDPALCRSLLPEEERRALEIVAIAWAQHPELEGASGWSAARATGSAKARYQRRSQSAPTVGSALCICMASCWVWFEYSNAEESKMTKQTKEPTRCAAVDEIEVLGQGQISSDLCCQLGGDPGEDAIAEIASKRDKKVFTWSICRGIVPYGTSPQSQRNTDAKTCDAIVALNQVLDMVDPAIYVFKDFHPYLSDPAVIRKLREVALYLKNSYKTLVLVSPTLRLPLELEKEISVVDFGLPGREDVNELLENTISEVNKNAGAETSASAIPPRSRSSTQPWALRSTRPRTCSPRLS